MNISKEQVEQVLSTLDGPTIEVTVRRGGNLHLTFEQLKNVKALMDNNGEELESRDEVIMRAQIKAKEALKNAGIHARISNSRLVDGTWVHSPQHVGEQHSSPWCGNNSNTKQRNTTA